MWGQVKRVVVKSAREVFGSVRVRRGNRKCVGWNDQVKAVVRRKEAAWKEVFGSGDEEAKERCMEAYREKKGKVKRCVYQFGRKMNEDVNGNKKLFRKEVSKTNGGKVENCKRIKDGKRKLVLEEA